MSMRPAPKRRSALQQGPQPRNDTKTENPDAPLGPAGYHRALVGGAPGAMPSETFQYDVVYDTFKEDNEFWRNWQVVNCARNCPEESISQENASIRVVMNLPSDQKLYPTAYTPGFPTLPSTAGMSGPRREPKSIAGLPPGYSVALDVHILEDARIMLDFQRSFRQGQIDPKYRWLDAIVEEADSKGIGIGASERTPEARALAQNKNSQLAIASEQRPEAALRPPVGAVSTLALLSGGGGEQRKSPCDELKTYSEAYAEMGVDGKRAAYSSRMHQVYEECTLVNAFGTHDRLPPRESGSWGFVPKHTKDELVQIQARGKASDHQLDALLSRTRDGDLLASSAPK